VWTLQSVCEIRFSSFEHILMMRNTDKLFLTRVKMASNNPHLERLAPYLIGGGGGALAGGLIGGLTSGEDDGEVLRRTMGGAAIGGGLGLGAAGLHQHLPGYLAGLQKKKDMAAFAEALEQSDPLYNKSAPMEESFNTDLLRALIKRDGDAGGVLSPEQIKELNLQEFPPNETLAEMQYKLKGHGGPYNPMDTGNYASNPNYGNLSHTDKQILP
jgi:hypothetical protein